MEPRYSTAVHELMASGFSGPSDGPISEYVFTDKSESLPTEEAIQAKLKELKKQYSDRQYQRDRAVAYPPLEEQMDILYHGGVDALKAELKRTKDKFPKP